MVDMPKADNRGPMAPNQDAPPLYTLVGRTFFVVMSNLVTLNGVVRLGWNAVPLVMMFILEGLIVVAKDYIKNFFDKSSKHIKGVLPIELAFILFYGFFASLVFGPYDSLQSAVEDGFRLQRELISGELRLSLLALLFIHVVRLGQDLLAAGIFGGNFQRGLRPEGGSWMLLLFFAVMLAPLIARSGPNPRGGLTALVILKTLGELFSVWSVKIPGLKTRSRVRNKRKRPL